MKVVFFILVVTLFSCEKPEKDKCWTCTELENSKAVKIYSECDILIVAKKDGSRWITWSGNSATVHSINCKLKE
jgi:hypothetical protein